jgi:hypothetical protein
MSIVLSLNVININLFIIIRVILACGILHNICKNRNIPLPPDVPDDYHNDDQQDHNDQQNAPVAGLRYRDNFCNTYF